MIDYQQLMAQAGPISGPFTIQHKPHQQEWQIASQSAPRMSTGAAAQRRSGDEIIFTSINQ